jgi:hypothetical protein
MAYQSNDVEVGAAITTHRHQDHTGALAEIVTMTGAQPWCGEPDAEAIEATTGVTCRTMWDGDLFRLGDVELDVIGLVGHTLGSRHSNDLREGPGMVLMTMGRNNGSDFIVTDEGFESTGFGSCVHEDGGIIRSSQEGIVMPLYHVDPGSEAALIKVNDDVDLIKIGETLSSPSAR